MRLKFFVFLITVCIGYAQAIKIKLQAGTIYSGTLVSANENFLYISVNGSFIKILKSMISEIDGKPYAPAQSTSNSTSQPLQTPAVANTRNVDISAKNTTGNIIVHLKNGNSFTGTLVSENERIVVLNINGSSVNIFKSIISEIEDPSKNKTVSPNVTKELPSPVVADTSRSSSPKISQQEKNQSPDLSGNDNPTKQKTAVITETKDTVIHSAVPVQNDSQLASRTAINSPVPVTTKPVESVTSANVSLQNNNISQPELKKDTAHSNNTFQKISSGSTKAADTTKNQEKKVVKRTDGKIEIVLKNGAVFIGKIVSEDDRIVRFESDGVLINIIKQLIRDIDGVAFNKNGTTMQKDPLVTRREELYKNFSVNATTDTLPDLQRAFPKTDVPQGIKISQLIDSLHSVSWEKRSQATRILAATGLWGTEAIPELKKLLADTLMGSSYEPAWIDSSNVNQLLSPGDEAARALSRMGEPGFNALRTLLRDTSTLVRRRATFGLGELSSGPAWAELSNMLKDPDRGVRAVAVTGLRSTKFSDLIISMLKDDDAEVRADAAFMLGRMRERKAIRSLKTLLYDKRSFVRAQAADALCNIGGEEAVQHLISASQDANINVRENAAYALGETGDTVAVQPLLSLLRDKMTSVRIAAISALSQIKDPRAIPYLYSMLKDEDPQIRESAEIALKKHTDIPILINSLDNKKEIVRKNVLYMLWLMTGKDIGMDKKLWQEWYSKSQVPVKIPLKN